MNHIPSPDTSDTGIERLIQAKGLTAPRVTPADMEANITDTEIVKHVSRSGQVLRWAVLTTRNGFAVVGRPSVSVSPENDDAEVGVAVAIGNAKNELWPLMGYELRSRLAASVDAGIPIDDQDFLAGLSACNLEDGTCEACQ